MSNMDKTTYVEKIEVDGEKRTIRKFKCPKCGNKNLKYQIGTGIDGVDLSTANIQNVTYAVCPKCGNHFKTKQYTLVNKTAYCLLSLFLGGIGIHKFYAGKTTTGLLYLAVCWTFVPTIIAFGEFIMALSQKPDKNGKIWA